MPGTLGAFLRRMEGAAVATPADLRGCSQEEVRALEEAYGVRLPATYRDFLLAMGHRAGRLFAHDPTDASYAAVRAMTAEMRDLLREEPPPSAFELPPDALLVAGREGDHYDFIRCTGQADSPVWHFDTYRWQVREAHPSVLAWLDAWCDAAGWAAGRGYFDRRTSSSG